MSWGIFVEPFKNVEHIFPTQQRDVSTIVAKAKLDSNIKEIIIFGSSVTSACNPWSDIDVYFDLEEDKPLPYFGISTGLDAWTNFLVDKHLMSEIKEKGVVVYERDPNGQSIQ